MHRCLCFGQDLAAGELVAQDLAGNEDIGAVKAGTSSSDDLPYAPGLGTAEGRRYAVAAFPFRTKGEGSAGDTVGVEVVAMDAESGQEAWRTKWDLPKSYDTHLVTYVAGVTGRTAVVVSHGENRYPVTYGIDLVTHKVTWSETAFKAQLVQGTRVLGQRRGAEDALKLAAVDGGRGRDLWTGMEVGEDWTVRTFAPDSAWVGDPEGRAVIDSATSHGLNRTAPTPQLSAQTSGNASVSGGGGPAGRDRLHDRAGPISRCGGPRAGGAPHTFPRSCHGAQEQGRRSAVDQGPAKCGPERLGETAASRFAGFQRARRSAASIGTQVRSMNVMTWLPSSAPGPAAVLPWRRPGGVGRPGSGSRA